MQSHHTDLLIKMASGPSTYNTYQIVCLIFGMVIWTYLYIYLAYRGLKTGFVQMSLTLACGNIVWEFLWGFVFQSQYELWTLIGNGLAFLIDCTIFYAILRFVWPKVTIPFFKANLIALMIFGICVWATVWVSFYKQNLDTDGGGLSGNILNMFIAIWWTVELIATDGVGKMSSRLGWAKLLGDIPVSLFMMYTFPTLYFTITICWVSVIFDIAYLVIYYLKLNGKWIDLNSKS